MCIEWHAGRRPSGRTSLATRWIDAGTICTPAKSRAGARAFGTREW